MSGPLGSQQWMYASGGFYDHTIDNSLRFNDNDSAYLSWTPASAGNRKTWTWSGWVKRGNLNANTVGNIPTLFAAQDSSAGLYNVLEFLNNANNDIIYAQLCSTPANSAYYLETSQTFRDVAGWYHIVWAVDTTQSTASDRAKLYVNGEQVTNFTTAQYPPQNTDTDINYTVEHNIGKFPDYSRYFDGYMAEINFIDGQALDATSFGETKSGIWIPKDTSGLTFGTNGFRLAFGDSAAIGDDTSGNTNDWTANNLVASDVVLDSPTNNFANLMIHNHPAANSNAFSEGNLRFTPGTGDSARNTNRMAISNMLVSSGKWYAEAYIVDNGSAHFVGVGPKQTVSPTANNTRYAYVYSADGNSYVRTGASESISTYASSYTVGDVIGIYVDMDAATPVVYFSKNGQWSNGSGSWNQSSPSGGITLGDTFFTESADFPGTFTFHAVRASGAVSPTTIWNFGQDDTFTGNITAGGNADANGYGSFKYAPPTDALALCSANLPTGAIDTAADETPEEYFNTALYTGNGSTQSITGVNFQPSLTWIKSRSAAYDHVLIDAVRGVEKQIISNKTDAESQDAGKGLTSFDSDGFTVTLGVSTSYNNSSQTYAAWNWKANGAGVANTDGTISSTVSVGATSEQNWFSIASYTGNATAGATIGHGLGVAPDMIIVKSRDAARDWRVYHSSLGSSYTMDLNTTLAVQGPNSAYWNSTDPTSSVFSVGSVTTVNGSGEDYISYCFADAEGLCKTGKYTGNGSADGPFIYTGFRPAFVLRKRTDNNSQWKIIDTARDTYNLADAILYPNLNNAEASPGSDAIDITSNGFKCRGTDSDTNLNGGSYIYLAIAEQPFKYANAR